MFQNCNKTWILTIYSGFLTVLLILIILYKHEKVSLISFRVPQSPLNLPLNLTLNLTYPPRRRTTPRPVQFRAQRSTTATTRKAVTSKAFSCGDYVIFSNGYGDGRGLGNQLFNLAAGVMIAQLTGRRIAINNSIISSTLLEDLFDHTYERFNSTCEAYGVGDNLNLAYNPELELMEANKTSKFSNKVLVLGGFFQSWKYTMNERLLRSKYLKIKSEFRQFVNKFFDSNLPVGWRPGTFTRVAIHVRRGDVLRKDKVNFGYTTPEVLYFKKAMMYLIEMYRRVQFIVVSNDNVWSRSNLSPSLFHGHNMTSFSVNITYAPTGNNGNIDMTLLASCHHSIMSTGTYGWWGAWLSRGTTIYYKDWPKPGTSLYAMFRKEDFFPPNWIGMSN